MKNENTFKKIVIIFCICFIVISTVFLTIGIHSFIVEPTTMHCILMMAEAVVICLCATLIYLFSAK